MGNFKNLLILGHLNCLPKGNHLSSATQGTGFWSAIYTVQCIFPLSPFTSKMRATLAKLSFAGAHTTCRCIVLFISSLFRLSGASRSTGVLRPAVPCFSVCPCPVCSCQWRWKMGERKRDCVFLESTAQLGDLILGSRDLAPRHCPFTLLIMLFWHRAITIWGMQLASWTGGGGVTSVMVIRVAALLTPFGWPLCAYTSLDKTT